VTDVVYLLVIVIFFAVCAAYVRGLDRIVRRAEEEDPGRDGSH
jgi:hypothetical protein